MNTIQVQLTEQQFEGLQDLIPYAMDYLDNRIAGEGDNENRDDLIAEVVRAGEIAEALYATKTYLWTSGDGHLELEIPAEAVDDIAQPGNNEPAVLTALEEYPYLHHQLSIQKTTDIVVYLRSAGIEDAEDKSTDELEAYLLWMACWDIHEERNQED